MRFSNCTPEQIVDYLLSISYRQNGHLYLPLGGKRGSRVFISGSKKTKFSRRPYISYHMYSFPVARLIVLTQAGYNILTAHSNLMGLHKLSCNDSFCIDPDHLYLGNAGDNNRDRILRSLSL